MGELVEVVTLGPASETVGITRQALRAHVRRGALRPIARTSTGILLFSREEIERFASEREIRRGLQPSPRAQGDGRRAVQP